MTCRVLALLCLCLNFLPLPAQSYKQLWNKIEKLQQEDLPQSVASVARDIYEKAKREHHPAQMMKACLTGMAARQDITPDSIEGDLARLSRWADTESDSVDAAVLHSIAGELYVRRNPALAARHLEQSLKPVRRLNNIQAGGYIPLTTAGRTSQLYEGDRLYLLLVRRAIRLWSDHANRLTLATGRQEEAVCDSLYQAALDYAERNGLREAYLLWRCDRLDDRLRRGKLSRPEAIAVCRELTAEYRDAKLGSVAYSRLARLLGEEKQYEEAMDSLRAALARRPRYEGFERLIQDSLRLTRPEFSLRRDIFYPGKEELLHISHRNTPLLDLHIYRLTGQDIARIAAYDEKDAYWKGKEKYLRTEHYALRSSPYESRDTLLPLTLSDEGYYLLEAVARGSEAAETCKPKRFVAYVSPLAIVTSQAYEGQRKAMVVDRRTGVPVAGAEVQHYTSKRGAYRLVSTRRTDADGLFDWPAPSERPACVRAVTPEHPYMPLTSDFAYFHPKPGEERGERITLYADRTLYRPGQTVYVAGLYFSRSGDSLSVRRDKELTLSLRDANGKEVESLTARTNDYGSFHASFILPSPCLPGAFTVRAADGRTTNTLPFRVEEYKRPRFEVTFHPVGTAYTYGDTVWVSGQARMFTGMAVQDAEVHYTVRRTSFDRDREALSARGGNVQTDSAGVFRFPVVIEPEETERTGLYLPGCTYLYTAKVTTEAGDAQEAAGELRVATRYDFELSGSAKEWIKEEPSPITFRVRNGQGEQLDRRVRYEVFPLSGRDGRLQEGERMFAAEAASNVSFLPEAVYGLPSGRYRLKATLLVPEKCPAQTADFALFALSDGKLPAGHDLFLHVSSSSETGRPAVWVGSSRREVHLFATAYKATGELEGSHKVLSDTLLCMRRPERTEELPMRVGFAFMQEGELYHREATLPHPEPDRRLTARWQTFRDKLQAGGKEEWRLRLTDRQGRPAGAELLATLYDASLDRLVPRRLWGLPLSFGRHMPSLSYELIQGNQLLVHLSFHRKSPAFKEWEYSRIEVPLPDSYNKFFMVRSPKARGAVAAAYDGGDEAVFEAVAMDYNGGDEAVFAASKTSETIRYEADEEEEAATEESTLPDIPLRKEFSETAFFYPHLRTNEEGEIQIVFTLPESLTTWRFFGLAHTENMNYALLDTTAVATKEFMLQTQLPRFVRAGDHTTLSATLSNLSDRIVKGTVYLELSDPVTEKVFHKAHASFRVAAGRTTAVTFACEIPRSYKLMTCRMVADGGTYSDGEQQLLPVLDNRERVTESIDLNLDGAGEQSVSLDSLFNRQSPTAADRRLTVEWTGNPSWLAVMALPSIASPSDKNALSLVAAYYAASLSSWITAQNPRLRTLFEAWRTHEDGEPLRSALQQNEELKELLLEYSPFLVDAENETTRRRRLAELFDESTLRHRMEVFARQLQALQSAEGGWSWYEGMSPNLYVTRQVVETLLRLQSLTGENRSEVAKLCQKGMEWLEAEAVKEYRRLLKRDSRPAVLSESAAHYLYLCLLADRQPTGEAKKAYDLFLTQLKNSSAEMTIRGKAVGAMILAGKGERKAADSFLQSMLEYSVYTPEMGRYYDARKALSGWTDYRIPTQTVAMEALGRLGGEQKTLLEMRRWLLKQKQVQGWDNPVSTVDAIYALLKADPTLWQERPLPVLTLDGKPIPTDQAVPGLNSLKHTVSLSAGEPAPRTFTAHQAEQGMAWGAVYAQYTEETARIPARSQGLSVSRTFYVERDVKGQPRWVEWKGEKLKAGDKVKSTLLLQADRDMDFIQVKENRASCMEPAAVLSGYRWERGIGFYRAIKEATVEYYFDRFPKGSHTVESVYRITAEGRYETGTVKVQSAYAPAFGGQAPSVKWEVRR